jgi:integrase
MATTTAKLTARQVQTLGTGFHSDGANLFLRVKDSGARSWVFRYKAGGRVRELGLGSIKARGLADAREVAAKMRKEIADGKDPAGVLRRGDAQALTFKQCAEALIEAKRPGWRNVKHAQQWENTLRDYAYPTLGEKAPADIGLADVKAVLSGIWATKTETAVRLRQRIEMVLDYAAVHGLADGTRNPARWKGVLDKVLASPNKVRNREHHAAAPYSSVPTIMAALRGKAQISALCLRFVILTGVRSGEARGAVWSEIDLEKKTWTIPADRMKAQREHRVPLCAEAVEVLKFAKEWKRVNSDRVFPGARGGLLSDVAVNKALHAIAPDATVHGFRSAFRDWGAEQTSFPSAVLELALAHVNPNKVEAAYQRSDLFDRRVDLMRTWGEFAKSGGNVIHMASTQAQVA